MPKGINSNCKIVISVFLNTSKQTLCFLFVLYDNPQKRRWEHRIEEKENERTGMN